MDTDLPKTDYVLNFNFDVKFMINDPAVSIQKHENYNFLNSCDLYIHVRFYT